MADQDRWNEQRGRYAAEDQARRGYRDYPGPADYGSDDFERGGGYGRDAGYPTPDYGIQGYGDYGTQGYGGQAYAGQSYGMEAGREHGGERSWMERAGERIGSWFGAGDGGSHRGRGPKNYARSDERVRDDINDRLTDDTWIDASEIEVLVTACEVTLSGTVASRDEKRRAEDLADQVSGVKHVQNNLRVERQSGVTQSDEGPASTSTPTPRPLADKDKSGPAGNA